MWVQRAVWCFSFNLPPQIRSNAPVGNSKWCHYPTAVPTTQCFTMQCVCMCVCACVCACENLYWLDSFPVSLSSFKTPGILQAVLKALGRLRFPLCAWDTHTHTLPVSHTHTLTVSHTHTLTVNPNCSCREWHEKRVGKGGETWEKLGCFYSRTITNHQRITSFYSHVSVLRARACAEIEGNSICTVSYLSAVWKPACLAHPVLSNLIP